MKHIFGQFPLLKWFRFLFFNIKWRIHNRNNFTYVNTKFSIKKVEVGNNTYGSLNIISYNNNSEKLSIGNYCSISSNVTFILSGEHNYKNLTTFPFKNIFNKDIECLCKGPIIIDDDVWIGYGSIILSGVHVGKGAVIGAGSIVSKDIPPYAIYANGKIIKYRFSKKIIDKLLNVNINFSKKTVVNHIKELYTEIDESNIDDIINNILI